MPNKDPAAQSFSLDDLFTIEKLAAAYPEFLKVETLRWQLRHREDNGLADCCVKVGKKLLISKTRYEGWLASGVNAG